MNVRFVFFSVLYKNPSPHAIKPSLFFNFNSTAGAKMYWVRGQHGHLGCTEAGASAKGDFRCKERFPQKKQTNNPCMRQLGCVEQQQSVELLAEMYEGDNDKDWSLSLLLLTFDWLEFSAKHKKNESIYLCCGQKERAVLWCSAGRRHFKGKYMNSGRNGFWMDDWTHKTPQPAFSDIY